MAGQLKIGGSLIGGPADAVQGIFPGASFAAQLGFGAGDAKAFGACTGVLTRQVASPSAFVQLEGVGSDRTVTEGNLLYFRCNANMSLRITTDDGSGGNVVSVVPVSGLVVIEFDDAKFLKLLELQGTGPVEYLVSGNQ